MRELGDCRILVTGGAGFIGSALVWELNRRGIENLVVSDLLGESEKWKNLRPLRFRDYLEADHLRARLQSGALGNFDLILHLGASSATTEQNATYLIQNNYEFTKDLATWAIAHDARFVYASSAATYGDGTRGMSDADVRLGRLRPLNMYGYSKHLLDLHAQREGILNQLVGLKFFNVYGPNERHKGEMRSLVDKAYHQAVETGTIRLFKSYHPKYQDGGQMRDFLYVKDAAAMTIHLATHPSAGGLFNIGSGRAHTWLELAHAIFAALGQKPKIEFVEMPELIRGGYQYFTEAGIAKLRSTGYDRPVTPLGEAVADYVRNYLATGKHLGDED